jgi:hypothetical protein
MKTDESIPNEEDLLPLTGQVVLIDSDQDGLMAMTVALSNMRLRVTSVQPREPVRAALRIVKRQPAAIVMPLDGVCNLVDIRAILSANHSTRFVFLLPEFPPKAALARITAQYGAAILPQDGAPLVLAATLIAMLSRDAERLA